MSWWIGVEIDTGGDEPVDICDRNVTYNVSPMLSKALALPPRKDGDHEVFGLRLLHKAPCSEVGGVLAAAVERMERDRDEYLPMQPPNGWGSYDTALEDLRWLLAQVSAHPKGTVYVH